ncbi:MAG: tRNA threonylcarbamoyladenosine dehydratase [Tissierellia bacterium]|nr:tRNA threonylcarbamoyladenosine dehydratase [Tissierellia bacterium]
MTARQYERAERLLGPGSIQKLKSKRVILFGVGGVGSFAAEALIRTGLGHLTLVDYDRVEETNLNRQIHATQDTIGQFKTLVMRERLLSIDADAEIHTMELFYQPENRQSFRLIDYDYVIDAIDSVPSKIDLLAYARRQGLPVISAMGAGNKLDPTRFQVTDLNDTRVCPLAKVVRKGMRDLGITGIKAVWSDEQPIMLPDRDVVRSPGSVAYVPSVAGLVIASEVVKDLID